MNLEEGSLEMTRADLLDWLSCNGCHIETLPEIKAKVLKITNPKNGMTGWIDLPIDKRIVRDYSIYKLCTKLAVPVPTQATYMKSLFDKIENDGNIGFKKHRLS